MKDAYFKAHDGEYKISYTDYFYSLDLSNGSCTIVLEYNDETKEEMTITLE